MDLKYNLLYTWMAITFVEVAQIQANEFKCLTIYYNTSFEGKLSVVEKNILPYSSIAWGRGGAHIHIFVFTDHKNNRFQKKLIVQNM